jgi:hypothetical protein
MGVLGLDLFALIWEGILLLEDKLFLFGVIDLPFFFFGVMDSVIFF